MNFRFLKIKSIGVRLLFITVLFLQANIFLFSRDPGIRFNRITTETGLSQNAVNCIVQDKRGFMWFGTQDGLNRYDGYRFVIYKYDPMDPHSLSDSYIMSILEDQAGVLWIGTYTGGFNKFDRDKETFTHYLNDPDNPNSISNNYVRAIFESPANPGVLWIGTQGGFDKFNVKEKTFIHYTHNPGNPQGLTHNHVLTIFESPKNPGILWIGTEDGLNRFDIKKEQFTHYRKKTGDPHSLSDNMVFSIFEDPSGRLWVGTNDGLNVFDREKEQFTRFTFEPGNPNSLSNNHVRFIYESPREPGIIWVGTYGSGLNRFDPKKKEFTHWIHEPGNPNSINNDFILFLYEGRSGITWVGCEGGLNLFDRQRKKFAQYRHNPNNPNSLKHNDVRTIFEDRHNNLWIGTYGGGISRFDRKNAQFTHYIPDPADPNSLNSYSVRVIIEDSNGILWIGTYDGGLNRFDPVSGRFTHYRYQPDNPNSPGSDYVRSIFEDSSGILWIGTYDGGLNRFDRRKEQFIRYTHDPEDPKSVSHNRVFALMEDKSGNLWVGTAGGLNKFNRETEKFTRYYHRPDDVHSLGKDMIMCVYEDRGETLWVGTYGGGLNRFNRETERFTHFTEREGLPNNVVYGILEDEEGALWLSTNNGISKFDPRKGTFKNYDMGDGLQHNEFNAGAYFKSRRSGEMFFGGFNGFNAFFPAEIKDSTYIPPVVITELRLFNTPVPIGEPEDASAILTKSITETGEIELSYRNNVLSFSYAALHYVSPGKNRYAYIMENLDQDWNRVGTGNTAAYTYIPPGKYVFRVKGSNNDGVWNEEVVSLKIRVVPPFWETWWFYLLCILAVFFSGISIFRLRVRQLKKRKEELERIVDLRTEELKNANKELEKLSIVARETDNAVMIMDAAGNFEWVNEGFTRMFGRTLEQLLEDKGKNFMDGSGNTNIKEVVQNCIKEKKTIDYECIDVTRSGKRIWTHTTFTPVLDSEGRLSKLVAIDSDITRVKESEERIKKQNEEILKQSQNLKKAFEIARKEREAADVANRSKSMFLARMSHEIRTPLNGVIGFSDLLLETDLNEQQSEYIMAITRCGETLLSLIDDILDISKIEAGKLTFEESDFDPEVLAFDVCNLILPRIGEREIEVLCKIGDTVPAYVKGDPGRIRQVLSNLMSNAVKFTSEGEIELTLDVEESSKNRLKLHAKVRDTGTGIPADKQGIIFELFQQANGSYARKYGGTGLGLAICKQIAMLMDGDVRVESEPGKGSTFHFTAWVEKSKKRPLKKSVEKRLKGKRILVVDDNANNLVILSNILKQSGLVTLALSKSDEVVPALLKSIEDKKPIDLCILDIRMPGMSGYDVAKQIRDHPDPRLSVLPLLAYTSSAAMKIKPFKESGFNGFLPKPIRKNKLLDMVVRLLGLGKKGIDELVKQKKILTRHTLTEEAKHSICILLVEDNKVNRKLAQYILSKGGYNVDVAENGREAVEKIVSDPGRFDLVLMDINMPEMDGREATKVLREKGFSNLPIIAMTAYAMKEDQEEFLKAGMDDYISKPIKREIVYKIVNKWVL
ncbi:MAG: response regulator [Candidatus Aminicenantes bacterium]|nr:response regulator [Candidatus Aminicenantes bacterium]